LPVVQPPPAYLLTAHKRPPQATHTPYVLLAGVGSAAYVGYTAAMSGLFGTVVAAVAPFLIIRETVVWWNRLKRRESYYQLAVARADFLKRPLIVIGDPDGGTTKTVNGFGDLCVDLTGCPNAPPAPDGSVTGVKADITKPGSIPAKDDSAVVYVCCVLEYVDDIDAAWKEILRVAGNPWNVVVVTVDPNTFTAYTYPHNRWVIDAAPPTSAELSYRSTKFRRYIAPPPRP